MNNAGTPKHFSDSCCNSEAAGYSLDMTNSQMKESCRKLEGANVARMEGDVDAGAITVTFMNGSKHTFQTVEEVEAAEKALRPSRANVPILGSLLHGIIGAPA